MLRDVQGKHADNVLHGWRAPKAAFENLVAPVERTPLREPANLTCVCQAAGHSGSNPSDKNAKEGKTKPVSKRHRHA